GTSAVKLVKRDAVRGEETEGAGPGLPPGFHQFELRFDNNDALPFNDAAFATIKVQEGRRILVIADNPGKSPDKGDAGLWYRALRASHEFPCTVISTTDAEQLGLNQLNDFEAVCLIDVRVPSSSLWGRLRQYVAESGKGLAIVLGGKDWLPSFEAYNWDGREVLGTKIEPLKDLEDSDGVGWKELELDSPKATLHPLVRYFRDQRELGEGVRFTDETLPRARIYWSVTRLVEQARVLA